MSRMKKYFLMVLLHSAILIVFILGYEQDVEATPDNTQFNKNTIWSDGAFPILPWDRPNESVNTKLSKKYGLSSISECNFNIAGFVKPSDIPLCEKLGLAVIVIGDIRRNWSKYSDREIDNAVKKMVYQSMNSDAVIGYYIADEPGASEFSALAKAVAAVKKYAPGKIAYINLFPNYANAGDKNTQLQAGSYEKYLERYVHIVKPQVICYDNYIILFSDNLKNLKKTKQYYRNLIDVRRVAIENNIVFWNTVPSCQIRPYSSKPSAANIRFHAYTTLAAGGRGICWYPYYSGSYEHTPIDASKNKTKTWYYLQKVNEQISMLGRKMNHLNSTGLFFSDASLIKDLPKLPGRLVKQVGSEAPVMVGEFEHYDGTKYAMIVNLSLEKTTNITLEPNSNFSKIQLIEPDEGTLKAIEMKHDIFLLPGQGRLFKLSP